jgi:catechol 2,3-dioxygenase-like lactoylglutathione lyase family enzyme
MPKSRQSSIACAHPEAELRQTVFDHLSIGVKDLTRSAAFYDAVLAAFGYVRLFENPRSVCYGPRGFAGEPPFAILAAGDNTVVPARFHLAFAAASRDQVDRFHAAALATGGTDDGPPGIRENYNSGYYAAFVCDPDGHRLEAVLHETTT